MNEERLKIFLITAGAVFMVIFCLMPFVYMILTSLSTNPDFLSEQSQFRLTLKHYYSILTVPSLHFPDYLRNSIPSPG